MRTQRLNFTPIPRQVFQGALNNELDIAPASNRRRLIQRVWSTQKPVIANLRLLTPLPAATGMSVIIRVTKRMARWMVPVGPNGVDVVARGGRASTAARR